MVFTPGLIYYWISWILWTVITFLQRKSKLRTQLACFLLVILILSQQTITVAKYTFSISYILLLIISWIYLLIIPHLYYHLFVLAMIVFSYMTILWIQLFEPIWLIMPTFLLIPLVSIFFNFVFIKFFHHQIISTVLGFCIGEYLFFELIMQEYHQKLIGDLLFFDQLLITVVLLYVIHLGQFGIKMLFNRFKARRISSDKKIKIPS